MSTIKSFAVGNGDMYYIKHNSDNFSIIDCCLSNDNQERIVDEIIQEKKNKTLTRFISTHPDDDHFCGIKYLDERIEILNFYCVENNAVKNSITDHFTHYCGLRDSQKVFHLEQGCSRKWMNLSDAERGSAGINILWPIVNNQHYREALTVAEQGGSPNNISPIFTYSLENGATVVWMGDLETDFIEKIKDEVKWPKATILFAPHHGRHTGKIPEDILQIVLPEIIVIGEAPSKDLNYYNNYNTITQNTAGDITFECVEKKVHVAVSNFYYTASYLSKELNFMPGYIGTLNL